MELSEDTKFNIPLRNIIGLVAGSVVATSAYLQLDSRLTALEHRNEIDRMEIIANSDFRIRWPRGEIGSLPADAEQFLRIEAHDRDIEKLYKLQDELIDVRIQLGQVLSEIQQIKEEKQWQPSPSKTGTGHTSCSRPVSNRRVSKFGTLGGH